MHIYVFKYEILARIGGVASDDTSWKQVVVCGYVFQSDVFHGHMRVSWALFNYWIEERATWVKASRLMLLLRTDVDGP